MILCVARGFRVVRGRWKDIMAAEKMVKREKIGTFLKSPAVLRIVVEIGGGSVACEARTEGF